MTLRLAGPSAALRRLASMAAAASLVATILPLMAVPAVSAVTPGSPGPLLYAQYNTAGEQQLWTCIPGGEAVPVPGTTGARGGRWSPDGRVIAFNLWGDGIYLINPDGSGRREIADWNDGEIFSEPIWSPDGRRIAFFVYIPGGVSQIQMMDSVDGTPERVDTELVEVWEWLDDGTFLGAAWRFGPQYTNGRNEELAEMSPDGTMTFLTDTPVEDEGVPRLSPDGTRISFLSFHEEVGGYQYSLGVMDRDGSDQHRFPLGTQVTWPAWSPTGNEIAIGPVPAAIRPDGTGKHALTSNGGSGDGLDWAALAGTTTEPVPPVGIRTEALPDPSTKTNTTVAATTIWPTKDGYRDTVRILQRMYEPAKATMDIFGPSGARVRRVTYHFDTGWVAYNWNGRSSTGVILPSGRYRIVTTSRDLAGNVRVLTRYVLLYRGYH